MHCDNGQGRWSARASGRVAAGPLPPPLRFGEGGHGAKSSTSEAGGGGAPHSGVTEGAAGAKRQRIGIALAQQAFGADAGEALDVVDHLHERADAGEELLRGEGARRLEEGAGLLPEAHLRDLAGAGADGEVEGGFMVDDQRLDVEPCARIVRQQAEALGAEDQADHQRDALPRRLDALLHRVVREERAG